MRLIDGIIGKARECASYLGNGTAVIEALSPRSGEIHRQQSEQLLEGKRPDGQDIRPYYSEDPYFATKAQSDWYRAWKQTTPYGRNPKRKPDAPNLYINGKFHSELGVYFEADAITITGKTAYAMEIVNKYGMDTFGLSDERWNALMQEVLPGIRQRIRQILLSNG